jgi:hypothetical protein
MAEQSNHTLQTVAWRNKNTHNADKNTNSTCLPFSPFKGRSPLTLWTQFYIAPYVALCFILPIVGYFFYADIRILFHETFGIYEINTGFCQPFPYFGKNTYWCRDINGFLLMPSGKIYLSYQKLSKMMMLQHKA